MKQDFFFHFTYKKILFAAIATGIISSIILSCATTIPQPTEIDAQRATKQWHDVHIQDLENGRMLYINHCSGCHSLHSPKYYTEQQWKKIFPGMAMRAHLAENDSELIFRYLLTFAKDSSYTMK
jgi:uncharacterized membrane protein